MIANRSIFLYGPTGNGKTSIAERLLRIYQDTVLVPYARARWTATSSRSSTPWCTRPLELEDDLIWTTRWVVCRRPCIMVGGELVSGMLELRLDESTGIYAAPLQMKANNGILDHRRFRPPGDARRASC